jgi:hypothetical protein
MTSSVHIAIIKLVTIVAPYENAESLAGELHDLGVTAFTSSRADGRGLHGPRNYGVLDGANVRMEMLVNADLARKILDYVAVAHDGDAMVAFAVEAEAAPRRRFV